MSKLLIEEVQPGELFSYFVGIGIHQINFERITRTGRAEDGILCPKNTDIDKWAFDAYVESKKRNVEVNIFRTVEDAVKTKTLTGCKMRMCQRLVTTINPDGTISGCPNTANTERIGDVFNGIDSRMFKMSCCKEENKNERCYMCRYFRYCNGECFQLSWDETGCPGFRRIMEYVSDEK
jgi:radical SAM protein with 4Fe4S-binding SPASM domain